MPVITVNYTHAIGHHLLQARESLPARKQMSIFVIHDCGYPGGGPQAERSFRIGVGVGQRL